MLRIPGDAGQKPSFLMPPARAFAAGSEAEPKLPYKEYEDEET